MGSFQNFSAPTAGGDDFQGELVSLMPTLRAFSRSLCRRHDLADDLVQETLMKAWRSQASFQTGTNLKAWLFTILRNCYYSNGRRSGREVSLDSDAAEKIAGPSDEQDLAMELSDTVSALQMLTRHHRDSVILVGVGGLSYEEAAKLCGTPVGTMKSRVARGRTALLTALEGPTGRPGHGEKRTVDPAIDLMTQLAFLMRQKADVVGVHA